MYNSQVAKHSKNLYLHADGDSFFVACELSVHPELKGKPVIVGGDRGIAVAMSMEAKKLGVTRGMPVFKIKKFYPEVVILSHHFDLYNDISERMRQILSSYFDKIEVYSIDECFALVDPSEIKYFGGPDKLLKELKNEIEKTLNVTYSLGLARTKALAKQASKLEKPAGVVMLLTEKDEEKALKSTPIDDIWGIGRQTVPRLKNLGMKTAYDFTKYSSLLLEKNFSAPLGVLQKELQGQEIMRVANDTDPRNQKSIQSTATFHPASTDIKIIWREIAENAEQACKNARELHLTTNSVSFFVKTSEFKYYFEEAHLPAWTADPGVILNAIESKLPKMLKNGEHIRSTGITLHKLTREERVPMDLFGQQEKLLKISAVEEEADKIRKKYGSGVIKRASTLNKDKTKKLRSKFTSF